MVRPDFGGVRPTRFICGASDGAKAETKALLDGWGWDTADMGGPAAARAIEPLCMLWCIPGLRGGSWSHSGAIWINATHRNNDFARPRISDFMYGFRCARSPL